MAALFDRVCAVTGKKQFPSQLMAELELAYVRDERSHGRQKAERIEVRIYHCPDCREYHLTSRPMRQAG
jgi:hypothetical protein